MKGAFKIAGSLCVLLLVCLVSHFPAFPAQGAEDVTPAISDNVIDYDYTTEEAQPFHEKGGNTLDRPSRVPMIKEMENVEKISRSFTVKADDTLVVENGGVLYIDSTCTFSLKGTLKIEEGGELYIRGKLDSKEGSSIYNRGKIKIMSTGILDLDGRILVSEGATVKGEGVLNVLDEFSDIRCKGTVTVNINAPEPVEKDGVTYVGGVLLVNKQYSLPEDYGTELDSAAYSAFVKMKQESGYEMELVSGFRSYLTQKYTFERWCSIDGYEKASMYSALPGHSEHQTGLAIDVTCLEEYYADTEEGKWLAANCYKYGFIIRYPKGKTDITGYIYEPWHIRYLGMSTAKLVYDSGLTLEEFLGVA